MPDSPADGARLSTVLDSVAGRLLESTVRLAVDGRPSGSGLIYSSDGLIITNAHVARQASIQARLADASTLPADVIARDPGADLALLRVPATGLTLSTLRDSTTVRPGEFVLAAGNPAGLAGSLVLGIMHAAPAGGSRWLVADIRLAPGYSGGPMADSQGRIVGINAMVAGGLGLAVPSNEMVRFVDNVTRPRFGIIVRPATYARPAARPGEALLVTVVSEGSPAARGGLTVGDLITGVDGSFESSAAETYRALRGGRHRVVLRVLRGGIAQSLEVWREPWEVAGKQAA